jgi:hypothetical protein
LDDTSAKSSFDAEWRDEKQNSKEETRHTEYDVEKALNPKKLKMSHFDDGLSDIAEEADGEFEEGSKDNDVGKEKIRNSVLQDRISVGVAKTADFRVVMKAGEPRVVEYTKL